MASFGAMAMMTCFLAVFCLITLPKMAASQRAIGRGYDRVEEMSPEILAEPRKRPFCNAFTGCGRKRSAPSQNQNQDQAKPNMHKIPMDESLEAILDLSSEPAVEDLSRQIMSEAKMWEAIQEAGAELMRRQLILQQASIPRSYQASK